MEINYTFNDTIKIELDDVTLLGDLAVVENAKGLVVFSHGSGSSRLSSRNRFVAEHLQRSRFSTLLFDLLTEEEDQEQASRFDIAKLTQRLINTTYWIQKDERVRDLNIGYFGASTGAASALGAAAALGPIVQAVVSRGGRPDLAAEVLADVLAPVLLIVGGKDDQVLAFNMQAQEQLQGIKDLQLVPDATHLFEEPGALEMAAQLATDWFRKYLQPSKQHPLRQDKP